MDSAVVEIADVRESAVGDAVFSSVHSKEITRQNFENISRTNPDFTRWMENAKTSGFLERSYRADKFRKFAGLVPIVEMTLGACDICYDTKRLERFWSCRTMTWRVLNPETGLIKPQSNSCRDRVCPACAEARVNTIAHNCCEFFEKQRDVRFLTLTFKHKDLPFKEQLKSDKKTFEKFRRGKEWKKYVTGCVYFLHIKQIKKSREYHIHFHIIFCGSYWPQKRLRAEWLEVTGDSNIVFIQAPHNEKELAQSVKDWSRYAGCPFNLREIRPENRLELVRAIDSVRVIGKTGICKSISLSPPKYEQGDSKGINLGRDSTLKMLAKSGDIDAFRMLYCSEESIPVKNVPSFRIIDDDIDNGSAGFLSPVEPSPLSLFSVNERSPPEAGACHYEGDESVENATW